MLVLTKYSSFYSQDTLKIQPKKPVFQVGTRNIRQSIAKYQVSNTTEQPRKLVFQVATEKQGNFIGKPASYVDKSTIQETSFPDHQGKEKLAEKGKNCWRTTGITSFRLFWKTEELQYQEKLVKLVVQVAITNIKNNKGKRPK